MTTAAVMIGPPRH